MAPGPDREDAHRRACADVLAHLRQTFVHHGYAYGLTFSVPLPQVDDCPCHAPAALDALPSADARAAALMQLHEELTVTWVAFHGWTLSAAQRLHLLADLGPAGGWTRWADPDRHREALLADVRAYATGTAHSPEVFEPDRDQLRSLAGAALWALSGVGGDQVEALLGRVDLPGALTVLAHLPVGTDASTVAAAVTGAFTEPAEAGRATLAR